uniref:TIMELESS-interacting protein n=1 Tax=Elaeophora elaphi TaxID=1147741 RepID=A0A0R3RIQ5_9BILA
MDIDYDSEALFVEDDGKEGEKTNRNATSTDEQILNDLLKKDERKIRKQRLVKNPKLRDIELCGPNGFLELKRSFDSYTPKNKNPYDDLLAIMNRIEHWGHLLCPKMRFEDFVARVESLGDKRMVKTMLTKMRLDMPLTDDDFFANKENEQDIQLSDREENEQFTDSLINDTDLFALFDDSQPGPVASHQATSSSGLPASKLSLEQLQRIEQNKRRAQELRMQREKRMNRINDFDSATRNNSARLRTKTVSNVPCNSKSFIQDGDSGRPEEEHIDIMMDDNEALDFIFSQSSPVI